MIFYATVGDFGHHVKYDNPAILTDITVPWNFAKCSAAFGLNLPQKNDPPVHVNSVEVIERY